MSPPQIPSPFHQGVAIMGWAIQQNQVKKNQYSVPVKARFQLLISTPLWEQDTLCSLGLVVFCPEMRCLDFLLLNYGVFPPQRWLCFKSGWFCREVPFAQFAKSISFSHVVEVGWKEYCNEWVWKSLTGIKTWLWPLLVSAITSNIPGWDASVWNTVEGLLALEVAITFFFGPKTRPELKLNLTYENFQWSGIFWWKKQFIKYWFPKGPEKNVADTLVPKDHTKWMLEGSRTVEEA